MGGPPSASHVVVGKDEVTLFQDLGAVPTSPDAACCPCLPSSAFFRHQSALPCSLLLAPVTPAAKRSPRTAAYCSPPSRSAPVPGSSSAALKEITEVERDSTGRRGEAENGLPTQALCMWIVNVDAGVHARTATLTMAMALPFLKTHVRLGSGFGARSHGCEPHPRGSQQQYTDESGFSRFESACNPSF